MKEILTRLDWLSQRKDQVILYKRFDPIVTMKRIGKIPGKFDSELLEFLRFTNGASILDYCFLGFKNEKLGTNIDNYMRELWPVRDILAGRFLAFMITSTGDNFGYLMDIVDEKGRHPIAFYSDQEDSDTICVIGSSFGAFMKTFVKYLEDSLDTSDGFILALPEATYPINTSHWLEKDEALQLMHANGVLSDYFKRNLPTITWR